MTRTLTLGARILVVGLLSLVIWVTNDSFMLVGSSESLSKMLLPSIAVQAGCVAFATFAVVMPGQVVLRVGWGVLAAAALLLAGHRLVVDVFKAEVHDVYLGVAVQTFRFDADAAPLDWQTSVAGLDVSQAGRAGHLWVFSPPWIGLDRGATTTLDAMR